MLSRTHPLYSALFAAATALSLSACATSSSTLLNGIDSAAIAQSADASAKTARLSTDPICTQFYANAVEYARAASQPNRGGQFLAATGLSALAAVATNGLFTGIGSATGQIAAQAATSQLIFQGGGAALSGLNSANKIDKRIISAAEGLGCPVQVGAP